MEVFPHIPLESYIHDARGREAGVQRFRNELKTFLKSNALTFMWLAQNMGKSEGTVKNWVYTSIRLDDNKLEKILALCKAHVAGGSGVVYEGASESEAIDYIWLTPFISLVEPDLPDELRPSVPKNDVDESKRVDVDEVHCLYKKWSVAAGIPEDTLFDMKALHYPALARWVTRTIMGATRLALQIAKVEGRLNPNATTDLGAVLQGSPCSSTFFAGVNLFEGYYVADGETSLRDVKFFLPVMKDEWRGEFVRLAAGASGYRSTDLWMVSVLNSAATEQVGNDLADFLEG